MPTGSRCGTRESSTFVGALIAGTFCSIASKVLLSFQAEGISGEVEPFQKPVFQTWGMFAGMCICLPLFGLNRLVTYLSARRRPYEKIPENAEISPDTACPSTSLLLMLALPSLFDLGATALCMFGLTHIPVSTYQVLRGGAIVFVAVLKHFALNDRLEAHMWCGVGIIVLAIGVVGLAAFVDTLGQDETSDSPSDSNPLLGVCLVLLGGAVQALQYVFEEKVMSDDVYNASPVLLIGMEGFWGIIMCTFIVYPIVSSMPGDDHGVIEDPSNTFYMITHSPDLQWMFSFYVAAIFVYNMLSVLVTYYLDSVWHAILDNFRPITVWLVDLSLHYFFLPSFGESWTRGSFLQLIALALLLYGTATCSKGVQRVSKATVPVKLNVTTPP